MAKTKATKRPAPVPIALLTADNHLAPGAWKSRPDIRGDAYYAFEQIVDVALSYRLPVLNLGDLIDTNQPDSQTIEFLRGQLTRLEEGLLRFYYLEGQHEDADPPWLQAVHDWPYYLDANCLPLAEHVFYGLSWRPAEELAAALQEIPPEANVLLAHQAWGELMGVGRADGSLTTVPHVQLVLTGDYHGQLPNDRTLNVQAADGRRLEVHSPGATCPQDISELGPKYVWLLNSDLSRTPIELKGRFSSVTEIDNEQELDNLLSSVDAILDRWKSQAEGLPEALHKPILRVTYPAELYEVRSRLLKTFGPHCHLFLDPQETLTREMQITEQKLKDVAGQGLRGCLPLLVEDEESPLFKLCAQLLRAETAGEDLGKYLEEFQHAYLTPAREEAAT